MDLAHILMDLVYGPGTWGACFVLFRVDGRLNRRNKAVFSNFSSVGSTGLIMNFLFAQNVHFVFNFEQEP